MASKKDFDVLSFSETWFNSAVSVMPVLKLKVTEFTD